MRIFTRIMVVVLTLCATPFWAQQSRTVDLKTTPQSISNYQSERLQIAQVAENPFVAFSVAIRGVDLAQSIKQVLYRDENGKWIPFPKESHYINNQAWNALVFLDQQISTTEVKIEFYNATEIHSVKANVYYPKSSAALTRDFPSEVQKNSVDDECGCAKPAIVSRSVWCPTNNCPPNPNPQATDVKFLIVHHTAGTNTSSDWAAVVRSIWNFHVNTNGWADIGYNFLIDTDGIIYQGRADDTQGAHFSGQNSGTSGMSLMGNFSSVSPSTAMITALESLLVWKSCDKNLNPIGTAFHNSSGKNLATISGHRDGGSTECPGDHVYAMLSSIRSEVDSALASCKLGVDDFDNPYVQVAPNPFGDELQIRPKQGGTFAISLYTILGQKVLEKVNVMDEVSLSTEHLSKGVYLLKIEDGMRTIQLKMLKK